MFVINKFTLYKIFMIKIYKFITGSSLNNHEPFHENPKILKNIIFTFKLLSLPTVSYTLTVQKVIQKQTTWLSVKGVPKW